MGSIRKDLRIKARSAVYCAIKKGELNKGTECELCGLRVTICAHHWAGYDMENWLNIWWICTSCNICLGDRHDGHMSKQEAIEFIKNYTIGQRAKELNQCQGMRKDGEKCKGIIPRNDVYCRYHRTPSDDNPMTTPIL